MKLSDFLFLPKPKPKEDEGAPRYADMNVRALAAMLDVALLFLLFQRPFDAMTQKLYASVDMALVAKAQASNHASEIMALLMQSYLPQLWALNLMIQVTILGIVYIAMQWMLEATPGKWLFGLRIVDAGTLEPPAKWRFIVRYVGYVVAAMPLMLGFIWTSFHPARRGWHDLMAGTAVICIRPRGWWWQQIKVLYQKLRARMK